MKLFAQVKHSVGTKVTFYFFHMLKETVSLFLKHNYVSEKKVQFPVVEISSAVLILPVGVTTGDELLSLKRKIRT